MDGKPVCACGSKLTRLSDRMLLVWADHEGERWNWHTDVQAYFRFCQICHMKMWPEDMRCRGKNCRPLTARWARFLDTSDGIARFESGDFYLTRPPPELVCPRVLPRRGPLQQPPGQPQPPESPTEPQPQLQPHQKARKLLKDAPVRPGILKKGAARDEVQTKTVHWADAGVWQRRAPPSAHSNGVVWMQGPQEKREGWNDAARQGIVTFIMDVPEEPRQGDRPFPFLGFWCCGLGCERPALREALWVQRRRVQHKQRDRTTYCGPCKTRCWTSAWTWDHALEDFCRPFCG